MDYSRIENIVFKKVFGENENKDILADFLVAVIGMKIKPNELTFTQNEQPPEV